MKTSLKSCLFLLLGAAISAQAQTIWTNGGPDLLWTTPANWSTGIAPTASDAVTFGNASTTNAAGAGAVNNIVPGSQSILSLSYSITNVGVNFHNTLINSGVTLTISGGAGNALFAGSGTDAGGNQLFATNSIFGSGATLDFESTGGNINVRQGTGNSTVGLGGTNHCATLDMSGLDTFIANAGRLLISGDGGSGANVSRLVGVLYLAKTNTINLSGTAPVLNIGDQPSNGRANPPIGLLSSFLFLGQTNAIFADTITVGRSKSPPVSMLFNPAFVSPKAYIRGQSGTRVTTYSIGDNSVQTTSNQGSDGTNDFTSGTVDLMADTMYVGRGENGGGNAAGTGTGTLNYGIGTVDVNTLEIGFQSASGAGAAVGTVKVNGGTLLANTSLRLARFAGGAGVPQATLIANNSTVQAATMIAGGGVVSVNLSGSTLTVSSNSFGGPVSSFNTTNTTLTLAAVLGNPTVLTTNLGVGGTTNRINIGIIPVITGYPSTFQIIKYTTLSGTPNIGLGTLPAATPTFKGYLTNDPTSLSINLVLTNGPATARILTWTGVQANPDWDQDNTANWKTNGGPATTFHDSDLVRFDDTAATNLVNLNGFPLLPTALTVSNLTKEYTFAGGGFISGPVGLTKQGGAKLTLDNSTFNDFSGGVTVSAGSIQIGNGDSQGSLGTSFVVNNGALLFNRTDAYTISNTISGSGSLTVVTNGILTLSGANTFDGTVTVARGTLLVDNNSALGSTNGSTIVNSGARLDLGTPTLGANNLNLGLESITVSGVGPDTNGVIINSSGNSQQNALRLLTLAGTSTLGGSGRWDIRGTGAALSTGGQPYSLIKTGANEVVIVDAIVDPALSDIDIQQGQLQFQGNVTSMGNTAGNLFVRAGASLFLNGTTNLFNKVFNLFGDGSTLTVSETGGSSTLIGPMTLNGDCRFNVASGATTLMLSNPITGSGTFTVAGPGTNALILGAPAKAYTGQTVVAAGKLVLNTILSGGGGLTNNSGSFLSGNGTNFGPAEINGTFSPGSIGVPGTFTVGGMTLQGNAVLNIDLGADTTPGSGSNDLIQVAGDLTVNGGMININTLGLLKNGQPYRLANYAGNLIWTSDPGINAPQNYSFTFNTNTIGQVNLISNGGPPVWNGGSSTGSLWSDAANWGGTPISSGQTLYFAGTTRLNNTNDNIDSYGLAFDISAGSFSLYGNPITLSANIVSISPNIEKVNLDLSINSAQTIDGGSGGLIIGGNVTNTVNNNVLTLAGSGTLSNRFVSSDITTVTNTLRMSAAGNWTLVDNSASTAITNPIQVDILAGTFNFGTGGSAPVLSSTTVNGAPQDHRVGNVANVTATFNMVNGTFSTIARLNTGLASGSTGIVNQVGGTMNIGNQFQGANATGGSSIVNVSGGTMNIRDTGLHQFYVASRGPGILNVSGSGVVNCSTLDVSRSINSSIPGVVNLDGGTIGASRVGTATANSGAGTTGSTGTFNFNGGTLKANASSTTFFQGNASGPAVPLVANVKAGGAIIDSDTNSITFLEPLQHDSGLGASPDGGLTKNGTGTLTLAAANSYNGLTLINNGTLLLTGSTSTGAVTVAVSGTLGGTGTVGGAVTVNGIIAPGVSSTNIGRLTVQSNVTVVGTASMKLDKGNVTNDVLTVSGTLTYGGVLSLTNLSGSLAASDSFKLFNAGVYSGSFSSIVPASPGVNLAWDTNFLGSGILKVASTVTGPTTNATITRATLSGTNVLVHGTNNNVPNTSFHYVVLTTANLTNSLTNWTPVVTNPFNPDGTFDYTNPIVPGTPRQFIDVKAVP